MLLSYWSKVPIPKVHLTNLNLQEICKYYVGF